MYFFNTCVTNERCVMAVWVQYQLRLKPGMCPPNGLQGINRALQREAELVMHRLDSKPKSQW